MQRAKLDGTASAAVRFGLISNQNRLKGQAMDITSDQREAWSKRPENLEWEGIIAPHYKRSNGVVDLEALHEIARLNGLMDTRSKYGQLNVGQVAMNIRNRLRILWKRGALKLPT